MAEDTEHDIVSAPRVRASEVFVTIREHFERMHNDLERKIDSNLVSTSQALERAQTTVQQGLDKAEKSLQTAIAETERRVNEKFDEKDRQAQREREALENRLKRFDDFQSQIAGERALYVQKDYLEPMLHAFRTELEARITSLNGLAQFNKGRDTVVGLIIGSVGAGALAFGIALLNHVWR